MPSCAVHVEPFRPRTLVVGLGKSGLSMIRFLSPMGLELAVCDSRDVPPGLDALREEFPDVAVFTGAFSAEVFSAADRILISPGVPVAEPVIQQALQRGAEVIGDVELFARECAAPVLAVTGSNGKSTVTTLLAAMGRAAGLRTVAGANLGTPALELLGDDVELYVLELSSFQLETTYSLRTQAAVVLNISADHMDRYPDLGGYAAAKARIFQGAEHAVVNLDDPLVTAMPRTGHTIGFTLGEPGPGDYGLRRIEGETWLCRGDEPLLRAAEVLIPGSHNLANVLAAWATGATAGLPDAAMAEAVRTFRGLPHRTEFVRERDGVRWYNDSKGTNIGATVAALRGLAADPAGRTVLIAGGEGKGQEFRELQPAVAESVRAVVLIGRDARLIEHALNGTVPILHAADMDEAVHRAAEAARPGDRVLLSPACASFDQFRGYDHRGRVFTEAVGRLVP